MKGEDFISYVSVPSLQTIATTRIVIKLWELKCFPNATDYTMGDDCSKGDDYEDDTDSDDNYPGTNDENTESTFYFRSFDVMKKEVLDNLSALPLSLRLKEEIMNHVIPIGTDLFNWLFTNSTPQFDARKMVHRVFWTAEGTVDASKTFRSAFDRHREDRSLIVPIMNSCSDLVEEVWKRMPKRYRDIYSTYNNELLRKLGYRYHLVMFWISHFGGDLSRLIGIIKQNDPRGIYDQDASVYVNMFNLSVQTRNDLAAKYFFPKLTEEEKDGNIWRWIDRLMVFIQYRQHNLIDKRNNGLLGILFFLLGQMKDSEQQREVIQKYYRQIIPVMVSDWPWQKYLSKTISSMFPFMTTQSYFFIMRDIVLSVEIYGVKWGLLKEIWSISPSQLKMSFVRHMIESGVDRERLFHSFITAGELDTFKQIINCASDHEKIELVFLCAKSKTFLSTAINDLNTINEFLKEILPSESDVSACKASLTGYLRGMGAFVLFLTSNRQRSEEFLRWCFESEEGANQYIEYFLHW